MAEILHQLIGSLSHYLQGFIHPRWCRISSINSMKRPEVVENTFCSFLFSLNFTLLPQELTLLPQELTLLPRNSEKIPKSLQTWPVLLFFFGSLRMDFLVHSVCSFMAGLEQLRVVCFFPSGTTHEQWQTTWLFKGYLGDDKLPSYVGITYFIHHEIRTPINQPGFHGK